jgi:hypothetical protein
LYPTGVWWVGETIRDCATLQGSALPPAGWRIALGLYDLATGQRLPVTDRTGTELSDGQVVVKP